MSDLSTQHARGKIHVVVSIASGTRQAQDFYNANLAPALQKLGQSDHETHYTESEDTISELTCDVFIPNAVQGRPQTILLLSGDGGMVDIINTVLESALFQTRDRSKYVKPIISIFPLGTGNALANSLKIAQDDDDNDSGNAMGLATYTKGKPISLPIFRATFSPGSRLLAHEAKDELALKDNSLWGCVVCSWGLHASLVADSDTAEYRKHGADRFKLAAKENLFPDHGHGPHKYAGKVSVLRKDGQWHVMERKEHAYVLATLVSNLEKTFVISPDSKSLDGQLRLVHFGPMSGEEVMKIMMAAYDGGKHVQDRRVIYDEIDGLRIDFDEEDERWRRVCVDGKIVRVDKGGWVEIKREESEVLDVLCL